eukprot:TRINITY_DN4061_c0_g2_i4.p1 TRINITY_DN4061_c0_g2~~TRINITY_DN4061_c0_g2_i4.p1  ORF type:complete len:902 (-),score=9.09 TRINITY_DN4061_c0_g2_i4:345-3050(-)
MAIIWPILAAFLVLMLAACQWAEAALIQASDLVVLNSIKNSMFPESAFSSWVAEDDCESNSWQGIYCDYDGYVTTLGFRYAPLAVTSGTIPSNIADLKYLTTINFPSCGLTGSLPSSIGTMTTLSELYLPSNSLSGLIPATLGKLSNLYLLDLSNNQFTGPLPDLFTKTNKTLGILDVSNNHLSGPIPVALSSIKYALISLYGNQFSGPLHLDFIQDYELSYLPIDFTNLYITGPVSVREGRGPFCVNLIGNCVVTQPSSCPKFKQRSNAECNKFCQSLQPGGTCGGHGTCLLAFGVYSCSCDLGFGTVASNPHTCLLDSLILNTTLGLEGPSPTANPIHRNALFRYASTGFLNTGVLGGAAWEGAFSWDWTNLVEDVQDQQTCRGCWAFATVAALKTALLITNNMARLPDLSVQQFLDCTSDGADNCTIGGWPGDALEFAASHNLATSSVYGAFSVNSKKCKKVPKLYDDPACYEDESVNHAVLLVGYNLVGSQRYWIIKNSWTINWGLRGYMHLGMQGGDGVCGINVLPGLMPIFTGNDPCYSKSYGHIVLKNDGHNPPGTLNPCGGAACKGSGKTNICTSCPTGFAQATNTDGSRTCAPVNPCNFFLYNPCGFGTCAPTVSPGIYTCLCPPGYVAAPMAIDSTQITCAFDVRSITTSPQTFTVPTTASGVTCTLVASLYGISLVKLKASNPKINCGLALVGGTKVLIPANRACALPYFTNLGDTCGSLVKLFGLSSVSMLGATNPNIDCSKELPVGQQVCLKIGTPLDVPLCTKYHTVNTTDTCSSIIKDLFDGDATTFFLVNPGINCRLLVLSLQGSSSSGSADFGQQICLQSTTQSSIVGKCRAPKKVFTVPRGMTCLTLLRLHFQNSMKVFKAANGGARCPLHGLRSGARVCYKP